MTKTEHLSVIIDELTYRTMSEPLSTLCSCNVHKLSMAKKLLEAGEKNLDGAVCLVVGFLTDAMVVALNSKGSRLPLSTISELANLVGSAESLPEDSRQVSIDFGGNPVICQV